MTAPWLILSGYILIGLLVTMIMDHFARMKASAFLVGTFVWPLVLLIAIATRIKARRRSS
jgi:hypothetical protein